MIRESTVFYRSFYEAVKDLGGDEFKECVTSLMEYALNGEDVASSGMAKMFLQMAKPQIDKNNQRYENGKKGGAKLTKPEPKLTKPEPKPTKPEPKPTKPEPKLTKPEPNVNDNVNDNVNVNVNDKEKTPTVSKRKSDKRFCPPSLQDVQSYCLERRNKVDAEKFIDFYASNGWKVGKNAMKDWKAAVRTWEKREGFDRPNRASTPKSTKFSNFTERNGDISDLERRLISV